MRLSFALAALATVVAAAAHKRDDSGLAVELRRIGNTEIKALITNTGSSDLRLLKTNTILSRAPVEKVQVSHNNTRVPFVGAWVSVARDHVDDSAFEPLSAGKTVESVFDLARMFDLSKGGEYTIQARDSIPVADAHINTTRSLAYASNTLHLHVDGGQAAQSRAANTKRATTQGCTGTRLLVIKMAVERCRLLAYRAEMRADHGPADRMDEFFKRSDRPTRDAVARTFRDVGAVCASLTDGPAAIECDDVRAECTLDTMALTYPDLNRIVLCDPFWYFISSQEAACHSVDRGAVLVHEATRLARVRRATGNDYNYYALAGNSAETNLNSADAYAFFAKSFAGELCYKNDDKGLWGLFSCRHRSGGGCIVVEGKTNVPPGFEHKIDSMGGTWGQTCFAFDKPNCQGEMLTMEGAPSGESYELPNDWVERISAFRCTS